MVIRREKKGDWSGQVREDELLAEAVVMDRVKEWFFRFLFRDQRVVKS